MPFCDKKKYLKVRIRKCVANTCFMQHMAAMYLESFYSWQLFFGCCCFCTTWDWSRAYKITYRESPREQNRSVERAMSVNCFFFLCMREPLYVILYARDPSHVVQTQQQPKKKSPRVFDLRYIGVWRKTFLNSKFDQNFGHQKSWNKCTQMHEKSCQSLFWMIADSLAKSQFVLNSLQNKTIYV